MSGAVTKIASGGGTTVVRLSHFGIGSHTLHPEHVSFLQSEVAPILNRGGSILLMGMASRSGSAATNQALSQRRNDEVLKKLRSMVKTNFKVNQSVAVGEEAARDAKVGDGNEDPYWRAVQIVYWGNPEPPPPPAPRPEPTTQRVSLRRSMLDKTVKKSFVDVYGPGEKGDKAAAASEAIMYGPKQKNISSSIENAKEILLAEQKITTNPDFVLLRIIIHRLVIQRQPQRSPFPGEDGQLDFGGSIEQIRREFFYGRGGVQKVWVIEYVKVQNPKGEINDGGTRTTYIEPPKSLEF